MREELQAAFKALSVGFAILSNRVIREVNEAACQMLGYSRSELIGNSTRMWYFTDQEYEQASKLYDEVTMVGTVRSEIRLRHKDNKPIYVIKNISAINQEDISAGVVIALVDITERKKAEDALKKSELDLKTTLKAIPDLLFEITDDLQIINYHAPVMSELYTPPEIFMGKTIFEVMPPDVSEIIQAAIRDAGSNETGIHRGFSIQTGDAAGYGLV